MIKFQQIVLASAPTLKEEHIQVKAQWSLHSVWINNACCGVRCCLEQNIWQVKARCYFILFFFRKRSSWPRDLPCVNATSTGSFLLKVGNVFRNVWATCAMCSWHGPCRPRRRLLRAKREGSFCVGKISIGRSKGFVTPDGFVICFERRLFCVQFPFLWHGFIGHASVILSLCNVHFDEHLHCHVPSQVDLTICWFPQ